MKDAEDLLREADYLDNKAQDWLRLSQECITDSTRRKCLWNENQCRGAAVRRWKEAQAILNPVAELVRVGGVEVNLDDEDYTGFEIPDRIKALLGADAEGLV
jgi:hypothetical protein